VAKAERLLYRIYQKLDQRAQRLGKHELRQIVDLYNSIRWAFEKIGVKLLVVCHNRPDPMRRGVAVSIRKTAGNQMLIGD